MFGFIIFIIVLSSIGRLFSGPCHHHHHHHHCGGFGGWGGYGYPVAVPSYGYGNGFGGGFGDLMRGFGGNINIGRGGVGGA